MKNLVNAILAVMGDVENIEKNMTVGAGSNSYKGVSDKDVKIAVGKSMRKHGLVILPIEVNPTVRIDRWEEETFYNGQKGLKTKQSVFTEVEPKYLLLHTSGESQEITGYGHGVDTQDKSAGKATTYALKNVLLNVFLIPTGSVDDTDTKHSDDMQVPGDKSKNAEQPNQQAATTTTIAPSLKKVVEKTTSLSALNTIWNNNVPLHDNSEFVRLIALKRVEFATTVEELTEIFNSVPILHADVDFVSQLTAKKTEVKQAKNQKQTA